MNVFKTKQSTQSEPYNAWGILHEWLNWAIVYGIYTKSYCQTSNISHTLVYNTCWSFRCSWSIACRRCSNYIFIFYLTPWFQGNCKTMWETFKFSDLVRLILEVWRYSFIQYHSNNHVLKPCRFVTDKKSQDNTSLLKCNRNFFLECQKVVFKFITSISYFTRCIMRWFSMSR